MIERSKFQKSISSVDSAYRVACGEEQSPPKEDEIWVWANGNKAYKINLRGSFTQYTSTGRLSRTPYAIAGEFTQTNGVEYILQVHRYINRQIHREDQEKVKPIGYCWAILRECGTKEPRLTRLKVLYVYRSQYNLKKPDSSWTDYSLHVWPEIEDAHYLIISGHENRDHSLCLSPTKAQTLKLYQEYKAGRIKQHQDKIALHRKGLKMVEKQAEHK